MRKCRECDFVPEIEIKFTSNITRTGKTLIARALFKTLRDIGYDVSWKFTPETLDKFTEKQLDIPYSDINSAYKGFEYLNDHKEHRANIKIIPE